MGQRFGKLKEFLYNKTPLYYLRKVFSMSGNKKGSPKPLERVMVFIDGGYLREFCKDWFGHDNLDFKKIRDNLMYRFEKLQIYPFQANLIRIYYYDAIVDENHPKYDEQRKYFDDIDTELFYTVRLGKLVESTRRMKQKGVDVLMAIDSLTKAYQNQYETGMFVLGDGDYLHMIEAIKNAGKKTLLLCCLENTSEYLKRCFDMRITFEKRHMQEWWLK